MNILAVAHATTNSDYGFGGRIIWAIVAIVVLGGVLYFFGFRARKSIPAKQAAAGKTARAVGRGARRATSHATKGGKVPAPQPDDAA